jgi:hypothetical protein
MDTSLKNKKKQREQQQKKLKIKLRKSEEPPTDLEEEANICISS